MSTSQVENAKGLQWPVLDSAQLGILMEVGDAGDSAMIKEIAAQFLEDLTGMMGRIEAAMGASDFSQIATAAHNIKGSAATFGLCRTAMLARELEASARNGSEHESIAAIYQSLREAIVTGRAAMEAYLVER